MIEEYDDNAVAIEDVLCIKESEKALLVEINGVHRVWVPKSQIHDDSEVFEFDAAEGVGGRLIITKWLADRLELE